LGGGVWLGANTVNVKKELYRTLSLYEKKKSSVVGAGGKRKANPSLRTITIIESRREGVLKESSKPSGMTGNVGLSRSRTGKKQKKSWSWGAQGVCCKGDKGWLQTPLGLVERGWEYQKKWHERRKKAQCAQKKKLVSGNQGGGGRTTGIPNGGPTVNLKTEKRLLKKVSCTVF